MRLDFNVLWVDDQPERVNAQIRAIARKMEEEGFKFNSTLCKSIGEVRDSVVDNVFTDQIDMILVDWDLGGGIEGQEAIADIRETVPYKDIVFYSARTPVEKLRSLAFDKAAEGVYCASREDLVEEVIGVFDSLVKKVLDLDHSRGIVMGATSDIDYMVNACLRAIHGQYDQAGQDALFEEAKEFIEAKIDKLRDAVIKAKTNTTIVDCLNEHQLFTSNDRLRVLARALKTKKLDGHRAFRATVVKYLEDVVPKRNIYAHVVLVPQGQSHTLAGLEGQEVTLEETRDLRKLLLALRGEFRDLMIALQRGSDAA
jgi:hypothetical protein